MTGAPDTPTGTVGAGLDPVLTGDLFRPLHASLVDLLAGLPADAWRAATSAGAWTVKDVAAHLLDGDLRRISAQRDGWVGGGDDAPGDDLVSWLDRLNATWVSAARRISPSVLVGLLRWSGERVADLMEAADPHAPATFPVAWAGQDRSPMWLDMGREYTERWHHQDQIREAVGVPPLDDTRWLAPVVAVSLAALPHAYRGVTAPDGATVVLDVAGPAGGRWTLERNGAWRLVAGGRTDPTCRVAAEAPDLARLLLHRLEPTAARDVLAVHGDAALADPLLRARAVMV